MTCFDLDSVVYLHTGYGAIRRVIEECQLIPDTVNDSVSSVKCYIVCDAFSFI